MFNELICKKGNTFAITGEVTVEDESKDMTGWSISAAAMAADPNGELRSPTGPRTRAQVVWVDQTLGLYRILFAAAATANWGPNMLVDIRLQHAAYGVLNTDPIRVKVLTPVTA